MDKKSVLVFAILFLYGALCWAKIGDVIKSFPAPDQFPTGLAYDGKHLWLADRKTDLLYQIDISSGKTNATLPAPGFSPTGLAWDGSHLWCIDDKEKLLYRINPATGVAERIIEAYTNNPKDICWDGKLIWLADDKLDLILSIDPEDGMMISNFASPSSNPDGLTWDGKYLWISDRGENMLYRVEPQSGAVIAKLHTPDQYARGLAWDGAYLWNVDYQSDKIYKISLDNSTPLLKTDSKKQQLDLTFDFRNYGPGTVTQLDVYIAIPESRDNQELLAPISFDPQPTAVVTDNWGQKFAHFQVKNLESSVTFRTLMTVKATIWAIEYFINPDDVGSLTDIPADIQKQYLLDGKKLQITDPYIQQLGKTNFGDEKNPYWIARNIFNYLIEHLSYNLKPVGGWNPAPTVLKRGTASCSEYSFAFIALARASGLPARYVGAVSLRGDDASLDDVFHRWCEIYLPNYGWIPFDANKGDSKIPAVQADGIGDVDCRYIITTTSGGDSDYMDWTYNYNYRWQSKGKCRVYAESYGEWSPLKD